jgi:hypothetical protein
MVAAQKNGAFKSADDMLGESVQRPAPPVPVA